MKLQSPKGTRDLLPAECLNFKKVEEVFFTICRKYGFLPVELPIFEFTSVFARNLGETSDIVNKEMYSFLDRNGDSLTLRPEGTASLVRAFLSNGFERNLPVKWLYSGPMFRYERPQKGRYRQFSQLGAEWLGADDMYADVEILAMAHEFLSSLGIKKNITLELNTIGNEASRKIFNDALVNHLSQFREKLSPESQLRLEKNPMRILDSKQEQDQEFLESAPKLREFLDQESQDHFEFVQKGLTALGIPYSVNDRLVRGFDYYTHTVFEFTTDALGAQNAVLSGGRYDGLVQQMGGSQKTPSIGFGTGTDRLVLLLEDAPKRQRPVVFVGLEPSDEIEALKLAHTLRQSGFTCESLGSGNLGKKFKKADKLKAWAVVIVGGDEKLRGEVSIKILDSGEQMSCALNMLTNHFFKICQNRQLEIPVT